MSKTRIEITCMCCQQDGPHGGRGLRRGCYEMHRDAGTLSRFPIRGEQFPTRWRREEYATLRASNISPHRAAELLGISLRTAERYEARLRADACERIAA